MHTAVTTLFLHTLNKWFLFIQAPIKESLILYNDPEMNNLSVQCFQSECLYTDIKCDHCFSLLLSP